MTASWAATRLRLLRCSPTSPEWPSGQRVLDVGCGPGALTAELVRRLGPASVTAVDPSEPFVAAARERHPEVRRRARVGRGPPVPRRHLRRSARPARRALHDGSRRRPPRDGARHSREGRRGCLRLGSRRGRTGPTLRVLGGCDARSIPGARTSPRSPGHVRDTSRSSSTLRASDDVEEGSHHRERRAPDLRGVVGALHARRRAGGRLCRGPRSRATGGAS